MTPRRMPGPAYWASGGEVLGRAGPLTPARAVDVAAFLTRQAEARRGGGDVAAAALLGEMASELSRAIAAADGWRRAATGPGVASLRA
jgi:hypothetical protein